MNATEDAMAHAARRVRRTQQDVEPRLARFLERERGAVGADRAWAAFTCGREDLDRNGPIVQLYGPWFLYDWREPGGGLSGAERFLDAHGARLAAGEKAFLRTTAATPFSFHEVLEVERGRRLHVRDVLAGTEHQVYERGGSEVLQVGDIVFARIVPYEGVALMIGCGDIPLRPGDKLDVIHLREQIHEKHGAAPSREILAARADELRGSYLELRNRLVHPTPPQMTNTDGDAIEFHTLTCDVSSIEEALDALATLARGTTRSELLREAEYDADGRLRKVEFSWLAKGDDERGVTVLGNVVLEGGKLKAEVNSARRAARLRKELTKRLGAAMRNLTLGIKPLAEALEDFERDDTPERRKKRLEEDAAWRSKPEVQDAIRAIVERQWDGWVDEHIPALDGRTPRDAVRRPEGREKVEALLLDFERSTSRTDHDAYDFDRLRRKLGLRLRAPGPAPEV
jgi:hypothetical protein